MKHFKETIIAKPGFVKTKAWGLCGTIALFTGLALVMGTGTAHANEIETSDTTPTVTAVTTPTAETTALPTATAPVAPTTASETTTPTAETTPATVAPASETTSEAATSETPTSETATSETTSSSATTSETPEAVTATNATANTEPSYPEVKPEPKITKEGTEIIVENPDVHMEFPNGHGTYATNIVNYHVDFPNDITINNGDTVTVTLPKEMALPTKYSFDVTNPEGVVIGQAVADSAKNTIVTTFNDYFKNKPLNKSMNLQLSVKWSELIEPDKDYTISINGTVIKYHSSKNVIEEGPTRAIAKWGSQDKTDPSIINWVLQLNGGYLWSKQVLNDYQLVDTLGPNQKLIEDSITAEFIDNLSPFKSGGNAMHYIQDLKTSPTSFKFKIAKLDRAIYLYYKTRLTQAESDSYDPTNHVDITYKAPDPKSQGYDSRVALVNGKGDARGENITTPTSVTFKLSKELTGRDLKDGEFTFQLKAADGTLIDTKTNDKDGNIVFNPITYKQAGTYKYTVEEVKGNDEDIVYDTMKATILVAINKEGHAYVAHTTMPEDTIFNNTVKQTTPSETVLTFDKVLSKGTLKEGQFSFQLRDDQGNVIDTASNDKEGHITFKPLIHTKAGSYHYTVKEVNTNDEDIIYDNKVADVTIKVAKTIGDTLNSMVSTVTYPQDKTFTNTVKDLQPASTSFHFTKQFQGGTLKGGEFTFELRDDKGNVLDTVTNDKDGNIDFKPITYTSAGNHTYHVSEVKGLDPKVIYDTKIADLNVMVVKTIGETLNTLVSTTQYPQDTTFVNKVKDEKTATADIVFHKALHGRDLKAGEFTFNLRDDKGQIIAQASNDKDGKIAFTGLTYDKAGDYHYVVTEVKGNDEDVIYDDMVADVTVKVTQEIGETTNALVSSVVYPEDTTFDNHIKELKDARIDLNLSKALHGRDLKDGEFTFNLRDEKGQLLATATNDKDGRVSFKDLTFKQAGTYTYLVTEEKGSDKDVIYDTMTARIQVTVTKEIGDTANVLVSKITYPEDVTFDNTIKDEKAATADIVFHKALHGRDLKAGEFTFNLRDDKGQIIAQASNDKDGKIAFTGLTYDKAGDYHYVVTEVKGNDEDVIYDDMVADVTVKVTQEIGETANALVSSVVYPKDTTFDNRIKELKDAHIDLNLSKALHGRSLKESEFTFNLRDEHGQLLATATNDKDGRVSFKDLTFKQAGTYTYLVTEEKGSDKDVIYDAMTARIQVTVVKEIGDKLNILNAKVLYPSDVTFNNTIKETKAVDTSLTFHKALHGRDLKAGEFTFNLYDETGTVVARARNTKDGTITFNGLHYDKPGTHHYTVTEVKGTDEDVIYDNMVADVTVTVTKEFGDTINVLKSAVTYPTDVTFDNTIKELKPVTTSLTFDKLLKGRDLKENEFTFALFEHTDKGDLFQGFAQNDAKGHITFDRLDFDAVGTHHFFVKEVIGKDEDVIYDATVAKADITVTKDIHDTFNTLVSNVVYANKTFTNTIKELKGTEVTLTFHKMLHGRDLKDGEFMFALFEETDKGNVFYGFATNDAKGNITFDHLTFDRPGTHKFFVQEVIGKDTSVTYDNLIARATVTLEKVVGDTENHLKATVTYGDDIIFDNTVTPEKPKDDKPKGDKPKGDKPKGDTPKGNTPKEETPKETPRYQEGKELPRTGDEVSRLGLLGVVMLGLSFFGISRRKKEN